MRAFLDLLKNLDQTTSTLKKVESLKNYFEAVPAEEACWGLYLISGEKIPTKVNRTFIAETFCEFKNMPMWLFKESAYHVGDSSETMALLRGPLEKVLEPPELQDLIEKDLLQLKNRTDEEKKAFFFKCWSS